MDADVVLQRAEDLSREVARACEAGDYVTAERIAAEVVEMVHKHLGETVWPTRMH